jgi:hypothetical protein
MKNQGSPVTYSGCSSQPFSLQAFGVFLMVVGGFLPLQLTVLQLTATSHLGLAMSHAFLNCHEISLHLLLTWPQATVASKFALYLLLCYEQI